MHRRQVLGGVGGLLSTLPGCLWSGTSPSRATETPINSHVSNGTWWTYAHDTRNTGSTPAVGPTPAVAERWAFRGAKAVYTTPAIVDGTVYFGASDDHVYAVDARTGDKQWSFRTGYYVVSSPAVVDGTVYVGSGDTNVYALDATTGSERWRRETSAQIDPAVTVRDGVVVAAGREGDTIGWVHGLDRATGEVRWRHEVDDWVTNAPAVAGRTVYVATHRGTVYAFDLHSGEKRWERTKPPKEAAHLTAPAVVDGTLYVLVRAFEPEVGSRVYALSVDGGEQRWTTWLEGPNLPDTLAVADGTVYAASEGSTPCESDGEMPCATPKALLTALDANTGNIRWQRTWERSVDTGPTVADDGVYFVASDRVMALDPTDGRERWGYDLPEFAMRPPAVSDGVLYVGCADGALRALV